MDATWAFRLARAGLGAEPPATVAEALAAPAQDYVRDSVPVALLARLATLAPDDHRAAVDAGDVVVAHVMRGAIHGLDPADHARYGRALLAADEDQLGRQLGRQVQQRVAETGIAATAQLDQVADAVAGALDDGAALDRVQLHAALRERLPEPLLPWCAGCESHHVAPMLWRFATVRAGTRLDSDRRYRLADPGDADPADAVRGFLARYGPSTWQAFADWAGLAPAHGKALWDAVDTVEAGGGRLLAEDADAFASPPDPAPGVRLLPAGDPLLARPNRELLAPDPAVRKRLFRPVASPGAVLRDGELAGLWRAKAKGKRLEVTVEPLGRLAKAPVEAQAQRLAALRGASGVTMAFR